MGWVFGALIFVLGLTMVIAGVSGTGGQAWSIVTGHGTNDGAGPSSSVGGAVNGALQYPHG